MTNISLLIRKPLRNHKTRKLLVFLLLTGSVQFLTAALKKNSYELGERISDIGAVF